MDVSPVTSLSVLATPAVPAAGFLGTPSSSGASAPGVAVPPPVSTQTANTATDAGAQPPDQSSPGQVQQAIQQANEAFSQRGQNLSASFERDKETGIAVVKIVDTKTNETIVQMPPKAMIAYAQSVKEEHGIRGKLLYDLA